jgi:hypothetical protein
MTSYYFWFGIFVFVAYLIVIDNSVAYAITLISKILKFQYEKQKWWLLHNPRNPIVKWFMYRKSMKLAEELMKEFAEKETIQEYETK